MSIASPDSLSLQVKELFAKSNVQIQKDEIDTKITELNKYGIPEIEILRNTIRFFAKRHNVDVKNLSADPYNHIHRNIENLRNGEISIVRAKVVLLWEPTCEKVMQTGLIGDKTGTTKFMIAKSATVPALVEWKSYEFKNVIARPWMGQMSIYINKSSEVLEIHENIEVRITPELVAERIKAVSQILHPGTL